MKWKTANPHTRFYFFSALILLIGLGSSTWIYLQAENDSEQGFEHETAGSISYFSAPENSKKYVHDLELYGGKANVLANKFMSWFAGIWHGKSLAFTIAIITVFISLGIFFFARTAPPRKEG